MGKHQDVKEENTKNSSHSGIQNRESQGQTGISPEAVRRCLASKCCWDTSDSSLWRWMFLLPPSSLSLWSKGSACGHLSSAPTCAPSEDPQGKNKPNQSAAKRVQLLVLCRRSMPPNSKVKIQVAVASIKSFLSASATPLGQTSTCRQAGDDVWRAGKVKPPLPPVLELLMAIDTGDTHTLLKAGNWTKLWKLKSKYSCVFLFL